VNDARKAGSHGKADQLALEGGLHRHSGHASTRSVPVAFNASDKQSTHLTRLTRACAGLSHEEREEMEQNPANGGRGPTSGAG
jgi:hypothetical protein